MLHKLHDTALYFKQVIITYILKSIKMQFIVLQLFQPLSASFEDFQFIKTAKLGGGGGADSRQENTQHQHESEQKSVWHITLTNIAENNFLLLVSIQF